MVGSGFNFNLAAFKPYHDFSDFDLPASLKLGRSLRDRFVGLSSCVARLLHESHICGDVCACQGSSMPEISSQALLAEPRLHTWGS